MKKPNPYVAYFLLVLILTAGNTCSGSSSRTTALASKDQVQEEAPSKSPKKKVPERIPPSGGSDEIPPPGDIETTKEVLLRVIKDNPTKDIQALLISSKTKHKTIVDAFSDVVDKKQIGKLLATPAVKGMLRADYKTDTNSKTKVDALLDKVVTSKDQALIKETLIAICKADKEEEINAAAIGYKKVEALPAEHIMAGTINEADSASKDGGALNTLIWERVDETQIVPLLATPAVKDMLRANDKNSKTKVDALLDKVVTSTDQALIKETLIAICEADSDKEGIIEEEAIGYKKVEALLDLCVIEKCAFMEVYNASRVGGALNTLIWTRGHYLFYFSPDPKFILGNPVKTPNSTIHLTEVESDGESVKEIKSPQNANKSVFCLNSFGGVDDPDEICNRNASVLSLGNIVFTAGSPFDPNEIIPLTEHNGDKKRSSSVLRLGNIFFPAESPSDAESFSDSEEIIFPTEYDNKKRKSAVLLLGNIAPLNKKRSFSLSDIGDTSKYTKSKIKRRNSLNNLQGAKRRKSTEYENKQGSNEGDDESEISVLSAAVKPGKTQSPTNNENKTITLESDNDLVLKTNAGDWLPKGISNMCEKSIKDMSGGIFNECLLNAVADVHKVLCKDCIDEIVATLIKYVEANSAAIIKAPNSEEVTYKVGHQDGVLYSVANKLKEKEEKKEIDRKQLCYLLHEIDEAVEKRRKKKLNPEGGR